MHCAVQSELAPWVQKQVCLARGTALLEAAALGVDATPMEGFDNAALDHELGLREQDDAAASLPKSRMAHHQLFTFV